MVMSQVSRITERRARVLVEERVVRRPHGRVVHIHRRHQGFELSCHSRVSLATVTALGAPSPLARHSTPISRHPAKARERRRRGHLYRGRARRPRASACRKASEPTVRSLSLHAVVADPYRSWPQAKVALNAHNDALATELSTSEFRVEQYGPACTYRAMLEVSHGMPKTSSGEYLQPIGGNKVSGQTVRMCALLDQGENCAAVLSRSARRSSA
jgi:hypothetical protein